MMMVFVVVDDDDDLITGHSRQPSPHDIQTNTHSHNIGGGDDNNSWIW